METIKACNARCKMCSHTDWEKNRDKVMSPVFFKKIVQEMAGCNEWIESVCLSRNGEPTLDKHLAHRVSLLKQAGIRKTTFSTNGQLLNSKLVMDLMEAGLDDIMVSIDSLNKEVFEKIRIGLNFDVVLANTLNLIKLRNQYKPDMNIRVRMVKMKENAQELDHYISFWKTKLKPTDDIYAMDMHSWGNQLFSEESSKVDFYADKPCVSPFSTMIILVDGTVPFCGNDYNGKIKMGDLTNSSIKEIWKDQPFSKARHLHATGQRNDIHMCRGCDIWERNTYGIKSDSHGSKDNIRGSNSNAMAAK